MESLRLENLNTTVVVKKNQNLKNNNNINNNYEEKYLSFNSQETLVYSWENLNASVKERSEQFNIKDLFETKPIKQILKDVSGIAKPGELLAIMGSSGSGKTTLLDVLNFRNNMKINGEIKINGQPIYSAKSLSFIAGYVTQEDLFFDTLTVKEHLTFHAMLRLDKSINKIERIKRVESVLNDLNLKKCEDNFIGNPERGLKGISNGEKRRLAVATELLTNASLLMADEPTSGLDSFMAEAIIYCLKNLAKQGKTIICTIHQPSSDVFQMFDKLYLMAEGRVAFYGSLNEASEYFSSQNLRCPISYNPADFYIQKLAILPNKREECLENVQIICDNYQKSRYYNSMLNDFENTNTKLNNNFILNNPDNEYSTNSITQLRYLFWRSTLNSARDKVSTIVRTFQTIFFGIMFGLIYYKQELTENSIMNINGVIYMILMNTTMLYLMTTCVTFSYEIPIILKEHKNGMYRMITYYFSKILTELPINVLLAFIFLTIIYFMAKLNPLVDRFFICAGITVIIANIAIAFGGMISAITPSDTIAMKLASALMIPLNIFGGYYLNNGSVKEYLIWLRYISWIGYGNEVYLLNQWEGVKNITCNNPLQCPPGGLVGEQILEQLDMKKDNYNRDIGLLIAFYFIFRIIGYVGLLVRTRLTK